MAFISGLLGIGTLTGAVLTEPAGGGYARVPFTITTLVGGAATIDAQADFGIPTTQWGTALTSWAMFDAAGEQWWYGNFATPINANAAQTNGERVTILAGAISIAFATTTP